MSNQLFELRRGIAATLLARKYPFRVHYAPERADRNGVDPVVLIMRDRRANEAISAPQTGGGRQAAAASTKAPIMRSRQTAGLVKIYARSSVSGAKVEDHEELADYVADAVICAIDAWCVEGKAGLPTYVEARYLLPEELVTDGGEPEQFPGVVYQIRFFLGRGVAIRDYQKQGRALGLIAGVSGEVDVRLNEDETEVVPLP